MHCSAKKVFSEVVHHPKRNGTTGSSRNRTVTGALLLCNLPLLEYPQALGWSRVPDGKDLRDAARKQKKRVRRGVSVYYLPWWGLLACLAASGLVSYLVLARTRAGDSPWALYPLMAALAPLFLVGAMVVAITISVLLSALLEDPTERTGSKAAPEATTPAQTLERTVPATSPSPTTASPSGTASPTAASPSASASPTASASATPSASVGARRPR